MTDLISSWFLGTVHRKLQLLAQYLWTDFTTFFQTLIGPLRSNLNQAYNHVSGLTDNLTLSISMLQSLQTQSDRSQNRLSEELKGNSRFVSNITITHNELNRKKSVISVEKTRLLKLFSGLFFLSLFGITKTMFFAVIFAFYENVKKFLLKSQGEV